MTKPTRIRVDCCMVCPFSMSPGESATTYWNCHAEYDEHGWPLHIPRPKSTTRGISKPPRICPLRRSPRLVVLK